MDAVEKSEGNRQEQSRAWKKNNTFIHAEDIFPGLRFNSNQIQNNAPVRNPWTAGLEHLMAAYSGTSVAFRERETRLMCSSVVA